MFQILPRNGLKRSLLKPRAWRVETSSVPKDRQIIYRSNNFESFKFHERNGGRRGIQMVLLHENQRSWLHKRPYWSILLKVHSDFSWVKSILPSGFWTCTIPEFPGSTELYERPWIAIYWSFKSHSKPFSLPAWMMTIWIELINLTSYIINHQ